MNTMRWVLIDRSAGAKTSDGSQLSAAVLQQIADAVQAQINGEFSAEWGAQCSIRVAADAHDVHAGEWAFAFLPSLPDAPDASAYHDVKAGVPYSLCAVTTCASLLGPDGISVDVSHEILETFGDQGANLYAFDGHGKLHAVEMCDAVEMQTYVKTAKDGTAVHVSNWLTRAFFVPGAKGPFDYMTAAGMQPASKGPAGPFKTAAGHGGNYQIVGKWGGTAGQVTAHELVGARRKGVTPHWSARMAKRIARAS
jgi:hypothetical protein